MSEKTFIIPFTEEEGDKANTLVSILLETGYANTNHISGKIRVENMSTLTVWASYCFIFEQKLSVVAFNLKFKQPDNPKF